MIKLKTLLEDTDQNNNGYPDSTEGSNDNIPFPTWYNSFVEKLAVKLSERIMGLDASDLRFEMVHPHLMGLDGDIFNQGGLDFFPTAARSVLKQPEFANKAIMVYSRFQTMERKIADMYPELEDDIFNDEKFWIFIK
jgi:hypothetical protein